MNVLSLRVGKRFFDSGFSEAELTAEWISFRYAERTTWREHYRDYWISLAGSTLDRFDQSHDGHGAAKGALIGGLLLGGVGALAGAALGASKLHSIALRQDDVLLVVEITTAELQGLVGRGVTLGEPISGKPRCVATLSNAWTGTATAAVFLAVMCAFALLLTCVGRLGR